MPIATYLVIAACLFQLVCAVPLFAEGEKIVAVTVKGNKRIEAAAILNVVTMKAGDILYTEKTDADLRAIYKMGHFQDVQVSTEETDKGTVLVYTVQEKPVVREIRFEGNKELKEDKLKEALEIKQNAIFSQKDLDKSVVKLKKLYSDEGYYLAEVTPQVNKRTSGELTVNFRIVEGNKILIRTIHFDGNKVYSDRTLRGIMETKEKWFLSWLTGAGTYKEEVLKNDALLLTDYYLNNGYINVKVGEPTVRLTDAKDSLEVFVGITEGDQYTVDAIGFKGDMLESEATLRKELKNEPGEVFSRANLRADIATLTDVYGDKGYAFANANPIIKPDPAKKSVDLTFDMDKGELVHIERIAIAGNPKTRDKVIRRELRVTEGELYSATGIKKSKQNLMNLGYFEEATVATAKGSEHDKLNVNVNVKEKPTGTFSIGGGYSSLDGFIGQGSVQQSNFLGLGLKGNLSASIGGRSSTYSVGLTDPYFLDSKWTVGADIYRSERDYIDFSRRLTGGDIKGGYPITDTLGTFWMYKYEIKDIFNVNTAITNFPQIFPTLQEGTTSTSSLMASLTSNTTDYRLDPSSGMINSVSVEYAGLGGNNKYARYTTDHALFFPLYKKLILTTKFTLGYIQEIGNSPVPVDEKFYLGGIGSLRGYKTRTVCPVNQPALLDPNGQTTTIYLGGNKEGFNNTEFTFPILQDVGIKGVTFFDAGNAWGESEPMFRSFLMSYGGGIRWASPMGPLRLEYGIPINPRPGIDSRSGRFEFSIGSLF